MADANFTIGADGKAFSDALLNMQKDLDKLANGGTAKLARLGQAFNALSMGAGALKGIGGGILDLGKRIIQPAAAAERLNLSFEVLMGSESGMLQFMERLNQYAAETPFAIDEISESAKLLFANTSMSADQVMESIKQIGNISAMTGKSMVEIVRTFSKAYNSGVTNEVAESFEIMGVAVRKELATLLGVTFNDVKKLISENKISFAELNTVLMLLTTNGGKFAGGTDRLSQSLEGLYSTLEDNVNTALRTFGEQLLPTVKPIVEKLIQAVDTAIPTIEDLGVAFGEWMGDKVENNVLPAMDEMILRIPDIGIQCGFAAMKARELANDILGFVDAFKIFQSAEDSILEHRAMAAAEEKLGLKGMDAIWARLLNGSDYQKAVDEELEKLRPKTEAEQWREQQEKEWAAQKESILKNREIRKQRRFEEAQARDELRARERQQNEEWQAAEREKTRKETEARWKAEAAKREEESLKKENENARKSYQKRRRRYEQERRLKELEQKSIPEQRRELSRQAGELGVEGKVSPESIRARLDVLSEAGAKANEQEIAALERLLEAWNKLAERKEAYSKQRGEMSAQLRIDALEAAGQRRAAAMLREKLTVAQRVEELQNAGATKRQAMEQAQAESRVRQLAAINEAIQNSRVEFIQGHQAAEGGGGVSLRVASNTLELSRKRNELLKTVKDTVEKIERSQTSANNSNLAVLA